MTAVGLDRHGRYAATPAEISASVAPGPFCGEPTLDQLLAEPIVQQLMHRDRTDSASICQLLQETAAARTGGRPKRPATRRVRSPLSPAAVSVWPPYVAHLLVRLGAILFAVSPAIVCGWLAARSGRWDLFERAGSIVTTTGLIFASGRYIRHSVLELIVSRSDEHDPSLAEVLDEVIGTRIGLMLSGFGTLVWGWGAYLRWWSFLYMAVWGLFAARQMRRDYRILRGLTQHDVAHR
jgi:hypothetical protein